MKRIIFILTIVATLTATMAKAQDDSALMDEIKEQLSADEASQVMQAEEQIQRAKTLLEQVDAKQAQADKLRAEAKSLSKGEAKKKNKQADAIETPLYAQQVTAYNLYEKGNATIYGIFASNLQELASIGTIESSEEAKGYTAKSTEAWTKAANALKTVPTGKKADQKAVAKIKKDVNQNQLKAIAYQIDEYKYLLALDGKSTTSHDAEIAVKEEDDAPSAEESNNTGSVNSDSFDDEGFNFVHSDSNAERIIYKVQIAADQIPLSISRLRQICPTDDIINNELKNGIYRYTIGYFMNYEEAKEMAISLQSKGVDGAFVVAYKNGERIKEIRDVYNN